MESNEHGLESVRVLPDALVGLGFVLRAGEVVSAQCLGAYLEPLLRAGAVEWTTDESAISLR